jgi:hypothetical protein
MCYAAEMNFLLHCIVDFQDGFRADGFALVGQFKLSPAEIAANYGDDAHKFLL